MIKTFASYNNTLSIGCVYAMYSLSMIQSKRAQTIQLWTNCLPNENPQRTESRQRKTEWFFMPPIAYIKHRTLWENFSCEREREREQAKGKSIHHRRTHIRTNERLWNVTNQAYLWEKRIHLNNFRWVRIPLLQRWPKRLDLFMQKTSKLRLSLFRSHVFWSILTKLSTFNSKLILLYMLSRWIRKKTDGKFKLSCA